MTGRRGEGPVVSLIVAIDRGRGIGHAGKLPWHVPADLKRFRELTMGHHIVMGRRTYESIGRLLPGRRSVIVTRQAGYSVPGAIVAHSLDQALARCEGDAEVFVIGGAQLYRAALPCAARIYLTEIDGSFAADTWFPALPESHWRELARDRRAEPGVGYRGFDYVLLERTQPDATGCRSE